MIRPAVAVLSLLAFGVPAGADPQPSCAAVVTAAEAEKALGRKLREAESRVEGDGGSLCAWMKGDDGSFFTAAVQHWNEAAIKALPQDNTVAAFYDGWVESGKAAGATKAEELKGVGVRAVLMNPDPQSLVMIQLKDGVARIVGNNLTKKQITELARAVATP